MGNQATGRVAYPAFIGISAVATMAGDPGSINVAPVFGYQVLGAREDEDVRVLCVDVLRQAFVSIAGDRRKGQAPAEAERTVTGAGVVRQRELLAEARTTWADGNGRSHRSSSSNRIGGELLAHAPNGAATLGQGY